MAKKVVSNIREAIHNETQKDTHLSDSDHKSSEFLQGWESNYENILPGMEKMKLAIEEELKTTEQKLLNVQDKVDQLKKAKHKIEQAILAFSTTNEPNVQQNITTGSKQTLPEIIINALLSHSQGLSKVQLANEILRQGYKTASTPDNFEKTIYQTCHKLDNIKYDKVKKLYTMTK